MIQVNLMAFGVIIYKVFRQTALLKPEVSNYENIRSRMNTQGCSEMSLAVLDAYGKLMESYDEQHHGRKEKTRGLREIAIL
ncbi:hypothetical protein lerEdw1_003957 [Lerista edwardsae]|nr:hypothetical protein lerEdw1_003957 [Lerista edwardsae]